MDELKRIKIELKIVKENEKKLVDRINELEEEKSRIDKMAQAVSNVLNGTNDAEYVQKCKCWMCTYEWNGVYLNESSMCEQCYRNYPKHQSGSNDK